MKVSIIFPHLPERHEAKDTYERAIRERFIVKKLNQDGHDAKIMFLNYGPEYEISVDDTNVAFYPVDAKSIPKGRKFYTSKILGEYLKNFSPDIVLFKGMGYLLPWRLFTDGCLPRLFGFIVGGNTSDIMLSSSSIVYAEFLNQQKNFNTVPATILGKYVPDSDFREKDSPSKYDIVSVGDFSYRKNQRALQPLFDKYRILFVGDGTDLPNVMEMTDGKSMVTFSGKVEKHEVVDSISKARLMVHPSLSEGFPRVFAEAFACGVPVLALDRAIKGDFPQRKAGELVAASDLVKRVSGLLADDLLLTNYSKEARQIAEQSFRGDVVYNQFLLGLESTLNLQLKKGPSAYKIFLLYFRMLVWTLDYYLYQFGRPVKKLIKSILRR